MKIVFVPYKSDWDKLEGGCYALLDGRYVDASDTDKLQEALEESASRFLGKPAVFENAYWAGDFMVGRVLVIYCSEEIKV